MEHHPQILFTVVKKRTEKRFIERIDDPAKNWKFSYEM